MFVLEDHFIFFVGDRVVYKYPPPDRGRARAASGRYVPKETIPLNDGHIVLATLPRQELLYSVKCDDDGRLHLADESHLVTELEWNSASNTD